LCDNGVGCTYAEHAEQHQSTALAGRTYPEHMSRELLCLKDFLIGCMCGRGLCAGLISTPLRILVSHMPPSYNQGVPALPQPYQLLADNSLVLKDTRSFRVRVVL